MELGFGWLGALHGGWELIRKECAPVLGGCAERCGNAGRKDVVLALEV